MYFEGNKVKIRKADPHLRRVLYKIYGIQIENMSQITGIPIEKIRQDAIAGYLRYFEDEPKIIFKDKFYEDYCNAHGDLSQLKTYGYPERPITSNIYYGYYLKRLAPNQCEKPTYMLIAPDGTAKPFDGDTYEEAFEKAKSYAFKNQIFDDNIASRHVTNAALTLDEIYLFLSFLPKDFYQFTRKKLQTAITLIRSRKNKGKNNFNYPKFNGDL